MNTHSADENPQVLFEALTASIRAQAMAEQATTRPADNVRLMNVRQAAEYLGRTESAVRQLVFKKVIPVIRFDRAVRIDKRDLDRLIDEYRV